MTPVKIVIELDLETLNNIAADNPVGIVRSDTIEEKIVSLVSKKWGPTDRLFVVYEERIMVPTTLLMGAKVLSRGGKNKIAAIKHLRNHDEWNPSLHRNTEPDGLNYDGSVGRKHGLVICKAIIDEMWEEWGFAREWEA